MVECFVQIVRWDHDFCKGILVFIKNVLMRIPVRCVVTGQAAQTHHRIITALDDWEYGQPHGIGKPGQRGHQFGDDTAFANGTLEGKRVRIVGAGNIGSRYASFCTFFGADVSMWDPFANEPCFHRAGARREHFLERLVSDAEIFAPMLPLTPKTEGLIKKDHIEALPKGCLVVMVTRAAICDCEPLYRRVLDGELALAADVFDHEPLELGHPLLGRQSIQDNLIAAIQNLRILARRMRLPNKSPLFHVSSTLKSLILIPFQVVSDITANCAREIRFFTPLFGQQPVPC